jgi:hypothetical protein
MNNQGGLFEENIVVFQNPDGTINLGMQPHYKNKMVVSCWSCKQQMVCSLEYDFVKCCFCQQLINLSVYKTNSTTKYHFLPVSAKPK